MQMPEGSGAGIPEVQWEPLGGWKPFSIFVERPDGRTRLPPVEYSSKRSDARAKLGFMAKTFWRKWAFSYNGSPLAESHTLVHYGIGYGSKSFPNATVVRAVHILHEASPISN